MHCVDYWEVFTVNLSQLQYFQTVSRFENISQVAAVLHISQPALSRTISRLECEVGAKLFDRDGNRIRLNQAGKAYLKRVDRAVLELENGQNEVKNMNGKICGRVAFSSFANGILQDVVFSYIIRYPDVNIRHLIQSPLQMENSLELGEVDFALSLNPIPSPSINWTPLAEDELIALVSVDHPLSGQNTIPLSKLEGERLAIPDPDYGISQVVRQFCCQADFSPDFVYEGMDGSLIMDLLKKNLCVFVVPASVHLWKILADRSAFQKSGAPAKPPITVLRIVEPSCRFQYGICTIKGKRLPESVEQFLHMTTEHLNSWGASLDMMDWAAL